MFTLRLFGGALIEAPDGLLKGPAMQRRQLALLAFLSLHEGRPVSRDRLLATLWPESDTERARRSLADAVYLIRKSLGENALVSIGDDLALDGALVRSDVRAFDSALERGDVEDAVAHYAGPLLDGFHLPGAADFEHWLDVQRARYARSCLDALEKLALGAESVADWTAAAAWWRRAAVHEPLNTRVALRLMRALAGAGERAAAIRHGTAHAALLKEELGVGPDEQLEALLNELRAGTPARDASDAAPAPARVNGARAALQPPEQHTAVVPLAGSVVASPALEDPPPALAPASDSRAGVRARARPRTLGRAGIGAVPFLMVAAYVALAEGGRRELEANRELDANRVVVAPFQNRTGDPRLDVVGFMAADDVTRALLRAGLADVVAPSDVVQLTRPVAGAEAWQTAPRATALAEEAGAGTVISGVFYLRGDSLDFRVQILDAARGVVEAVLGPVLGARASPQSAIEQLRLRVLTEMSARRLLHGFNPIRDLGYATPDYQAYHAYWVGMDRFFRNDMHGAAERLAAAYRLDTTFLAALIFAGVAHLNLGAAAVADSLSRILTSRADRLSRAERFQAEWLSASATGDRPTAHRAAQELAELLPRSPWKYQVALDALRMHRPREALRHLVALDSTSGWVPDWPGYWQVISGAHHVLGQHEEELKVARHGRRRGNPSRPLRLLSYETRALGALGRIDELHAALDEAFMIGPSPETPGEVARTAALELVAHGYADAAGRVFARAIAWYGDRPADEDRGWELQLAETLYAAGHLDEAQALLSALDKANPGVLNVRARLGVLAARLGDRAAAIEISDWLDRDGTSPGARRIRLVWQARIAAQLGEAARAIELLHHAGAGFGAFDAHRDPDFQPLRRERAFRALISPQG